jgi:predicted HicB family RNase H-like nuclease
MKYDVDKYSYALEWSEEDEAYIARCREFPSLSAHGDNPEEALKEIRYVVKESIEWLEEEGDPVPLPYGLRNYKGNITLRVSPSIHRYLAIRAKEECISINQYITNLIESKIEYRSLYKKINNLQQLIQQIMDQIQFYPILSDRQVVSTEVERPNVAQFIKFITDNRSVYLVDDTFKSALGVGRQQLELITDNKDMLSDNVNQDTGCYE